MAGFTFRFYISFLNTCRSIRVQTLLRQSRPSYPNVGVRREGFARVLETFHIDVEIVAIVNLDRKQCRDSRQTRSSDDQSIYLNSPCLSSSQRSATVQQGRRRDRSQRKNENECLQGRQEKKKEKKRSRRAAHDRFSFFSLLVFVTPFSSRFITVPLLLSIDAIVSSGVYSRWRKISILLSFTDAFDDETAGKEHSDACFSPVC